MPLYKTIHANSTTTLKVWYITEPYTDLAASLDLKESSQSRVNSMKSELHKRGFLAVRHLLGLFGYTDADLFYDANGKAHFKDG